jgi:hypothetical protein
VLALRIVRLGIVHERFLTKQSESVGRKKAALGLALTAIEVDDHAHATIPYWLLLFHMYPSSSASLHTLST